MTINAPGGGNTVALTFSQQDASNDSSQIRINSDNTAAGLMVLNGDVNVSLTRGGASIINGQSQIDGSGGTGTGPWTDNGYGSLPGILDLGSATRTFTIASATTHDGSNSLDPGVGVDMLVSLNIQNGGIIKNGAGTLFLSNAGNGMTNSAVANNFTGGVTINAGTVQIDTATSLGGTNGTSTGIVTISGGTLEAVATITETNVNNRPFVLGSGTTNTILVDATKTYTIAGVISDASTNGSLTVGNAKATGTLVLSDTANTYDGGTNINGGTVSVSADRNLGSCPPSAIPMA